MDNRKERVAPSGKIGRTLFFAAFSALIAAIVFPSFLQAESEPERIRVPEDVTKGLEYILGLVGEEEPPVIDVERTAAVVEFVLSDDKAWPAMYCSNDEFGPESAYHEFWIDQSLGKILQYAYSPTIPSQAVIPSSIRVSFWKDLNGTVDAASWSWNFPANDGGTQTLSGVEHEETTPDVFSGTYYIYDLDKLMVLGRYRGRHVFFSVSRQKEKSPGKKAFALGGDKEWTYVYTDENGVNKAGMGWVTPYMYESFAVTVFVEYDPESPSKVKCAMFKWLSAGTAGINMVSTRHINAGIKRFESAFRAVLEHPDLPSPRKLSETFSRIENLPTDGIKREVDLYFKKLVRRYRKEEVFQDEEMAELFTSREYLDALTRKQMEGILGLEYMKQVLGKDPIIKVDRLLSRTPAFSLPKPRFAVKAAMKK